jgi:hypothetical protein
MPQLLLGGGGDGRLYGINEFDGHKLGDKANPAVQHADSLINGKRYKASISVRLHGDEATIDVLLNRQSLIHCTAPSAVYPSYYFADPCEGNRPVVGIAAGSDATFHAVRVSLAGGTGAIKRRRVTEECPLGQWIDLLPRIDLARDRLCGDFSRDGRGLALNARQDQGTLLLPVAVRGSYELEMEFTHEPAEAMISFVVPVGLRRVRVNPNLHGDLHPDPGIINQLDATHQLEAEVRHVLALEVRAEGGEATIDVHVDGKPWLSWAGTEADLHDGPILMSESDRIAFAATGTVTLHTARFRALSGKARLLTDEPATARP